MSISLKQFCTTAQVLKICFIIRFPNGSHWNRMLQNEFCLSGISVFPIWIGYIFVRHYQYLRPPSEIIPLIWHQNRVTTAELGLVIIGREKEAFHVIIPFIQLRKQSMTGRILKKINCRIEERDEIKFIDRWNSMQKMSHSFLNAHYKEPALKNGWGKHNEQNSRLNSEALTNCTLWRCQLFLSSFVFFNITWHVILPLPSTNLGFLQTIFMIRRRLSDVSMTTAFSLSFVSGVLIVLQSVDPL